MTLRTSRALGVFGATASLSLCVGVALPLGALAADSSQSGVADADVPALLPATSAEGDSNVLPSLDFENIRPDENDFMVPAAAGRFRLPDGTYHIGRPVPGGTGAGVVVPGLEEFYNQKLTWGPCEPFTADLSTSLADANAECAYLIVPVDYANPAGATAAIGLYKVKAKDPANRIGTLFHDPGGPGRSGMESAANFARSGSGVVADRFDYVGFDPRGVSSSLPMIRCYSSDAFDKQRGDADALSGDQKNAVSEYNTNQCYENTGKNFGIDGREFIANVGTRNVVRDLDIARSVLGEERINYLGYSYGTSIGYHYAKAFPDNIRTMVIDGVMNPFENNPEAAKIYEKYTESTSSGLIPEIAQLQGFQSTLDQYLKACATKNGFDDLGIDTPCATGTNPDPREALKEYQAIARSAWNSDVLVSADGRKVTFADITQATISAMYTEEHWPVLNQALYDIKHSQDGSMAMELADSYYNRNASGTYSFIQSAFQTIWCTDYGVVAGNNDPGAAQARLAKQYEVAPFTDPGVGEDGVQRGLRAEKDWCTYYGVTHTLPKGEDLFALPNVLVISTTYDSATPYQDGVVTADAINGTLLTVAGSNHTSYRPGTDNCAAKITEKYLTDLVVPTDIIGAQGVETKDLFSHVVTGNECRVDSFRPESALDNALTHPGKEVRVMASGLVRNSEYTLSLPVQLGVAPVGAVSDVDGLAYFTFTVPDGVELGEYDMSVVPSDLSLNDPLVRAAGKLTVVAGPKVTDVLPTVAPEISGSVSGPGSVTGSGSVTGTGKGLASTGSSAGGTLVVAAGAALAAAGVWALRRRRQQ